MKPKEFWTLVSPSVVVMTLLMVLPLCTTIYLSFFNFNFGVAPTFVGFLNYSRILEDSRFWSALGFTLMYMALSIPIQIVLGFMLALLLNEVSKFKRFFISIYLIPYIVTPVVGTLAVSWLFKDRGVITWLLSTIGVNVQWYADVLAARGLLIGYGIWGAIPFVMLMLYAGLQAMPSDPIEAAIMDGATWWQRVRFVVIPFLRPIFIFIVMVNIMDAYRLFDSVAVMTQGGPGNATATIMYYTYSVAFDEQLLGRASASVILAVLVIVALLFPFLRQTYIDIVGGKK
ncbi:MAG: carbohydrate ABC transporter permease [Deinococcales bacterium]